MPPALDPRFRGGDGKCFDATGSDSSVLILKFAASPFFVTPAKAGVHPAVDTGLRRYDESEGRRSDPANFRFRTLECLLICSFLSIAIPMG